MSIQERLDFLVNAAQRLQTLVVLAASENVQPWALMTEMQNHIQAILDGPILTVRPSLREELAVVQAWSPNMRSDLAAYFEAAEKHDLAYIWANQAQHVADLQVAHNVTRIALDQLVKLN